MTGLPIVGTWQEQHRRNKGEYRHALFWVRSFYGIAGYKNRHSGRAKIASFQRIIQSLAVKQLQRLWGLRQRKIGARATEKEASTYPQDKRTSWRSQFGNGSSPNWTSGTRGHTPRRHKCKFRHLKCTAFASLIPVNRWIAPFYLHLTIRKVCYSRFIRCA